MKKIITMLLSIFVVVSLGGFTNEVVVESYDYSGIYDDVPYYVIGEVEDDIVISSFSKSNDVEWVDNTYGDYIEFCDGELIIYEDLDVGIYDVNVCVDVNVCKLVRIVKTDSYDIKFNDGDDLIYGNNQNGVLSSIESIFGVVDGVSYKIYDLEDTSVCRIYSNYHEDKAYISKNDSVVLDDNVLDVGSYKINVNVINSAYKNMLGEVVEYGVYDAFNIVCKDAYFDIKVVDNLVYSGKELELMTIGKCEPSDAKIYFKVLNEKLDDSSINYDLIDVPSGRDAGEYYIYYFIDGGTSPNYKDVYGKESVSISRAILSVGEFESITYDGNDHRPLEVDIKPMVRGVVDDDAYTISYVEDDGAYKDVGIWPVKLSANNNYCFDSVCNIEVIRNLVIKDGKRVVNTVTY